MVRFLSSSLLGLALLAVVGCNQLPGKPKPGPEVPRPDEIVDFPTLYSQNCSGCHGDGGRNGSAYPLANPVYQSLVDESTLHNIIANGLPGTMMPAFSIAAGGMLTDQQIDILATKMRENWRKASELEGANAPSYRPTKAADVSHGAQVYATYCASCHGEASAAPKAKGGKAGSIVDPSFLALVSDQALRTVVIAGRPDLGQPDWRNDLAGYPMSDQEVTDVVGWLASMRPKKLGGGSQ